MSFFQVFYFLFVYKWRELSPWFWLVNLWFFKCNILSTNDLFPFFFLDGENFFFLCYERDIHTKMYIHTHIYTLVSEHVLISFAIFGWRLIICLYYNLGFLIFPILLKKKNRRVSFVDWKNFKTNKRVILFCRELVSRSRNLNQCKNRNLLEA